MKLSAKMIGEKLGKTAKEVNILLKESGFLEGKPGQWYLTELGNKFGELQRNENGYGGYARRAWEFVMWDESIVKKLMNK